MNKKKLTFSLLLIVLLISAFFYFFKEYNNPTNTTAVRGKKIEKEILIPTPSKMNQEKASKIARKESIKVSIFSDQNLSQIKECISSYSSKSPKDLKEAVLPPDSEVLFSRENTHLKSNSGVIYQKRSEGFPSEKKDYYYKLKNDLPILISQNEFDTETNKAEVIYEESIKRSKLAEIVTVDGKVIKIETNSSSFSLSCDYIENEWECFCFKEN